MAVSCEQYLRDLNKYYDSRGEQYDFAEGSAGGTSGIVSLERKHTTKASARTSGNRVHAPYQLIKKGAYAC